MAFLENVRRTIAETIYTPNPNRFAEASIAQSLPAVDYAPVNEPGSKQPLRQQQWYRLVNNNAREVGYLFLCGCGVSNAYLYGKYDLRRELEQDKPCSSLCVNIVTRKRDENGQPIYEQVRNVEKDKDGNVLPVGAYHNMLDMLPNRGERMSESERNKVYATLPCWRLNTQGSNQSGIVQVGDWGGSATNSPDDCWSGKPPLGSNGGWV